MGTQSDSPLKAPSATPPRPAPRTRQSGRHSVGCKVCSVRQSRERAGAGSTGLHEAPDSCAGWSRGVDALRTALLLRANPTTSSRVTGAVRVPHGPSNLKRGAQPTLSLRPPGLRPFTTVAQPWLLVLLGSVWGPNCCLWCLCSCCCRAHAAATGAHHCPHCPWQPKVCRGTRTPSSHLGTHQQRWAQAPRIWSLSTCSGSMKSTTDGALDQEEAILSEVSVPGWVSRGYIGTQSSLFIEFSYLSSLFLYGSTSPLLSCTDFYFILSLTSHSDLCTWQEFVVGTKVALGSRPLAPRNFHNCWTKVSIYRRL